MRSMTSRVVKLTLPIAPQQQIRPRATIRRGHGKIHAGIYDLRKVATYKRLVGMLAKQQYKGDPLTGALRVEITFYRSAQKSDSKKKHAQKLSGAIKPTVKPDTDNYLKSTLDGLNGVLWKDDALITTELAKKRYSDNPRIEIEVRPDE